MSIAILGFSSMLFDTLMDVDYKYIEKYKFSGGMGS
jgi:hypothetical protein